MTPIYFHRDILSAPITILGSNIVLLRVCKGIETVIKRGLEGDLVDQSSEINNNKSFLQKNLEFDNENERDEKDWLDKDLDDTSNSELDEATLRHIPSDVANASNNYANEQLAQILRGE